MLNQKEMIIQYIKDFGSITPAEAFLDLGIYNFSARLSELKDEGYAFVMKREKGKNRYGRPVSWGRYRLTQ
jgi:hypothetical protein